MKYIKNIPLLKYVLRIIVFIDVLFLRVNSYIGDISCLRLEHEHLLIIILSKKQDVDQKNIILISKA